MLVRKRLKSGSGITSSTLIELTVSVDGLLNSIVQNLVPYDRVVKIVELLAITAQLNHGRADGVSCV